ncbi:MAG: cob(I)yrinic acid a,c-diamide adenosyltransferase [Lentisphaeria bacterium]|nr:cob(I)yrinic acid a,c-diamide adenosyltransferase [Lentisphaeria bacterium]
MRHTHVYTGDGKGKTTAAVGLALRAAAAGWRVFFGQFIKPGTSAEITYFAEHCPAVTVAAFGREGFIFPPPKSEDVTAAEDGLERLRQAIQSGDYDLVIADEANSAVHAGLFGVEALLRLIDMADGRVELVFTGRNARPELIERADLVTDMRCVKHYFHDGTAARPGIEE